MHYDNFMFSWREDYTYITSGFLKCKNPVFALYVVYFLYTSECMSENLLPLQIKCQVLVHLIRTKNLVIMRFVGEQNNGLLNECMVCFFVKVKCFLVYQHHRVSISDEQLEFIP